jgi:CheY-like chemotaxis protein
MLVRHPGRAVRLSVSDDGPGMDAVTRGRLFEPITLTKPIDDSSALNLSELHDIVEAHDGVIGVDSEPGKGTIFTLYLPVAAPGDDVASATAPSNMGRGQRILYLDDDDALLYMVERYLVQRGFRISGYIDQQEALGVLRKDPRGFDLVVIDYNMPGMSGLDVARAVRGIRADLPIAVASGVIDESLRAQAEALGVRDFIFKVSDVEDLGAAFARLAQTVPRTAHA